MRCMAVSMLMSSLRTAGPPRLATFARGRLSTSPCRSRCEPLQIEICGSQNVIGRLRRQFHTKSMHVGDLPSYLEERRAHGTFCRDGRNLQSEGEEAREDRLY